MATMLNRSLRNRWLAMAAHAALWLLLCLAALDLRTKTPLFRDAKPTAAPVQSPALAAGLVRLFSPAAWQSSLSQTNLLDPFSTGYFIPPAPPAATTRKIQVTYQGFYQTVGGPKQVIFKLGDLYMVAAIGSSIVTNLFIADATMQTMTLTNLTAQTNALPLNTTKELVVPIGTALPAGAQAVPPQAGAAATAAVPATAPAHSAAAPPPAGHPGKSPERSGGSKVKGHA